MPSLRNLREIFVKEKIKFLFGLIAVTVRILGSRFTVLTRAFLNLLKKKAPFRKTKNNGVPKTDCFTEVFSNPALK
jgi:hypothetical protein